MHEELKSNERIFHVLRIHTTENQKFGEQSASTNKTHFKVHPKPFGIVFFSNQRHEVITFSQCGLDCLKPNTSRWNRLPVRTQKDLSMRISTLEQLFETDCYPNCI